MNAPWGARWIGPWVRKVPGFVSVSRGQAWKLRVAVPGAEILASLKQGRGRERHGVRVVPRAQFVFYARAEDMKAAGLPTVGNGWRNCGRRKPSEGA